MKTLIAIPARYGSTRFPGKPLAKIAGKEMLLRVWEIAQSAAKEFEDTKAVVATDDQKIVDFCKERNIDVVMTSDKCRTGTDRVKEAIANLGANPEFVVNLQGDNPLCPPWFVKSVIEAYYKDNNVEVVTPCVNLSWEGLDKLRESKKTTPFSGTTAIVDENSNGVWFSKNIIPAIRKEEQAKKENALSPVYRHVGLYGYRKDIIDRIGDLKEGVYEKFEGLEQLRFIENGISIKVVKVDYGDYEGMSGVDNPEDVPRAEALFEKYGEF
jgi:3-deoxy-manno-octulosonate cytidylyltransferase (CMP-KDO synthetase)